jgi:hypothetical protein
MKTCVGLLFLCLTATACFHSVDGTKVKCTTSDHCPSGYVCSAGKCVSGSGVTTDSGGPGVDSSAAADGRAGVDLAILRADVGSDISTTTPDAATDELLAGLDSADLTDVPLPGTGGTPGTGGATGAGGVIGSGGRVSSGGASGAGGVTSSGGVAASGGALATGGVTSNGGITGTGGTTCQPKARDCTSSLDNDCNGTPDKQETTYCACPVGQSRTCQEHPGYDGTGICKAGSQTCTASADKTTSSWGTCTGSVAPATEVCDAAGLDENCNGQSNEGCDCINGASVPCDCGPATTCTNGKKGTCSVTKVTMYLDSDKDGYGDPARPAMICPGTSGYVSNGDDCDDSDANFKPGVSVCASDYVTRKSCPTTGGSTSTEACGQGCLNGGCRPASDGTIGVPGYVSCDVKGCPASQGCTWGDSTCGTTASPGVVHCDGPNDCLGAQCCVYYGRGGVYSQCETGACQAGYYPACDPQSNTAGCSCTLYVSNFPIYVCM